MTGVLFLAEKEGFEPSRRLSQPTPLAGEPLRPLGYFSKSGFRIAYSILVNVPGENKWRREWDSNPRMLPHRRFSRPVPSTTRTSLHVRRPIRCEKYDTMFCTACQPKDAKNKAEECKSTIHIGQSNKKDEGNGLIG